jgi:hypothetical protein
MEALVYSSRRTPDKASWHNHMRTDAASAPLGGNRRASGEIAEERAAVETPRAEALGDREHHLAVRYPGHEERVLQPQRPER